MPVPEFYDKMRKGGIAKTSAVNMETFKDVFREELKRGNDVLYIAFSSGLSNTYNAGRLAAEELLEEFPDRRVIAVDTLAASAGQGLLVKIASELKADGKQSRRLQDLFLITAIICAIGLLLMISNT